MTRGIQQDIDLWQKFMETRTHLLPCTTKDGKVVQVPLQGALRPIQLWEYVFPKEDLDAVLTTLRFNEQIYPNTLKMKAAVAGLRKALGGKKWPEFKTDKRMFIPPNLNMQILPIGVKDEPKDKITLPDGTTHEYL